MKTFLSNLLNWHLSMRRATFSFGLLLASLLSVSRGVSADDTQLSAVSVNRGKALRTHVGVIVKESPQLILNDLVTGKQLTFKKSEIRQIRRDIGKAGAARPLGPRSRRQEEISGSLPPFVDRSDVELLQGELPARAVCRQQT